MTRIISVHQCSIHGDVNHVAFNLLPSDHRFCVFSVRFSSDGKDILAGLAKFQLWNLLPMIYSLVFYYSASDRCLYVYDREKNQRTLRVSEFLVYIEALTLILMGFRSAVMKMMLTMSLLPIALLRFYLVEEMTVSSKWKASDLVFIASAHTNVFISGMGSSDFIRRKTHASRSFWGPHGWHNLYRLKSKQVVPWRSCLALRCEMKMFYRGTLVTWYRTLKISQ